MKTALFISVLFISIFTLNNRQVNIDLLEGPTYHLMDNDNDGDYEFYMKSYNNNTYYYMGYIKGNDLKDQGHLYISYDEGRSHNPSNLWFVWEDMWEDEPLSLKVYDQEVNYGYLYETSVKSYDYTFKHIN